MKIKTLAAFFAIFVGISIIGVWTMLYITGSIPELNTEPIRIWMHLVAEMTTGIVLILGAYGLLRNKRWGYNVYLISMGMLIYTLIVSPGYYAEKGDYLFVGIFIIMAFFAIILIIASLLKKHDFTSNTK